MSILKICSFVQDRFVNFIYFCCMLVTKFVDAMLPLPIDDSNTTVDVCLLEHVVSSAIGRLAGSCQSDLCQGRSS